MNKLPFIISVVINIILIVCLVSLYNTHRKNAFQTMEDIAASEAILQKLILEDLESGDEARIENMKLRLRENVQQWEEFSR